MTRKKILYGLLESNIFCIVIIAYYYLVAQLPHELLVANPHPFLILAAVIGLRYGNYMGITGATISSIYYALVYNDQVGPFVEILGDVTYYKHILSIYWSAVILGIFRDNYTVVTQKLNNRILLMETGLEKLSRKYDESLAVNRDLKKQIIGAEQSILSLYEIASRLDSLNPEDVYTDTMGILKKFIHASAVSIFTVDLKNGDLLRLKLRMGHLKGSDVRTIDIVNSPGFDQVVRNKRIMKWNETSNIDFPLMSAPIIFEGKVIAVINIEDMDFDVLSEYAFNLFKVIVEWVSKSLAQAIHVEQQLRDEDYLSLTQFIDFFDFQERLQQEERRKEAFDLGYLHLRYTYSVNDFEDTKEQIGKLLRSVDVYSYETLSETLHFLLPATPDSAKVMINERIMKNLDYKVTPQ